MKTVQNERVFAAFLLTALVGLSGCSLISASPPVEKFEPLCHEGLKRFDRVTDDVYRGSQPDADQLRAIVAAHHIKTVIKLNGGLDPALPDVTILPHPLNAWITPSAEKVREILQSIDRAEKPVYIHCSHGEDRTGLIVALYRVCYLHVKPEDAYLDMAAHGFHPYPGVWKAWTREAGWKPALPKAPCLR
jgi:tyrosine-protein phosphatase SIW14